MKGLGRVGREEGLTLRIQECERSALGRAKGGSRSPCAAISFEILGSRSQIWTNGPRETLARSCSQVPDGRLFDLRCQSGLAFVFAECRNLHKNGDDEVKQGESVQKHSCDLNRIGQQFDSGSDSISAITK
jgi:hypothetical protein